MTTSEASHAEAAPALVSIIVPMYNEAMSVDVLFERLLNVLDTQNDQFEVLCIDDGSTDATASAVLAWQASRPEIKLLRLSRNFGKERALAAGFDHAVGDAVVPIDADLQDPPELIPAMLEAWRAGYDQVIAQRAARTDDSRRRRWSASGFYRLINRVSEVPLPAQSGDFRLLDRKVVRAICALPERTRFHKGLYAWVGFRTTHVTYDRPVRAAGDSRWTLWQLWNYALDGIFSFSTVPLRLWTYVGTLAAGAGFLYALFIVARTLIFGAVVPGYASMLVLLLVLSGLNMIGIGIVGEYVGRVFSETKNRPLYIIQDRYGFDEPERSRVRTVDLENGPATSTQERSGTEG